MSTVALEVRVLGPLWVGLGGARVRLSPSAAHTLAFLALGPPDGSPRGPMAASLFGNCAESVARRRLATSLWRLRNELREAAGRDIVDSTDSERVRIAPDVLLTVDAVDFVTRVDPVVAQPATVLSAADAACLEQAVEAYHGGLLESVYDEWVLEARDRLANVYLTALDHLVQYHGRGGSPHQVARFAERALELEPLREDFHRNAMVAYAGAGRADLVERQFERCRLALLRELGTDPLPETVAVYTRLSTGGRGPGSPEITALVTDLERARRDVRELAGLVERALDAVRRLR